MIEPIYQKETKRKMRVVLLFSGGASVLRYLLDHDPNCSSKYQFVGSFCNVQSASGVLLAKEAGIPTEILDYQQFIRERKAKFSDPATRRAYFERVVKLIEPWKPDIIIHSGFMLIVTEPYLSHFKHRILNVHPADLSILDEKGRRKYAGLHVVEKAFEAGESATRSTIHLVTEGVDEGPIVTISEPLAIEPGISPKAHQEKMKWACDGPAFQRALELIADGRVWIDLDTEAISIL